MSMIVNLVRVETGTLVELLAGSLPIIPFLYETDHREEWTLDLDKAWHAIHFLLAQDAWGGSEPYCYLVAGGEEIGDEDVGYGPARALTPTEVKAWDEALAVIDDEDMRQRFNPDRLVQEEIYPSIWDRDPEEDDGFGYMLHYYQELRTFLANAAASGHGLVVYCC